MLCSHNHPALAFHTWDELPLTARHTVAIRPARFDRCYIWSASKSNTAKSITSGAPVFNVPPKSNLTHNTHRGGLSIGHAALATTQSFFEKLANWRKNKR
jgi:hypothetical protein